MYFGGFDRLKERSVEVEVRLRVVVGECGWHGCSGREEALIRRLKAMVNHFAVKSGEAALKSGCALNFFRGKARV